MAADAIQAIRGGTENEHGYCADCHRCRARLHQGDAKRRNTAFASDRVCRNTFGTVVLTGHRINYDNVLLENLGGDNTGKLRLIAMDHTHCFTCGRELDSKLHNINSVQDDQLFGLFPGFVPLVRQHDIETAVADLATLDVSFVNDLVNEIPNEWQVLAAARNSLAKLIVQRAHYVAESVLPAISAVCWPGKLFDT